MSPVYRNPRPIPELVARLRKLGEARILLVDDGGGDSETLGVLRKLAGTDVGALVLAHNVGQNRAIYEGLRHAPVGPVVVMDADLQDTPELVPSLLAGLERWPVVFAQRRSTVQPPWERFTSALFKGLLRLASGGRLPPAVGTFVAMRPEVVQHLIQTQPRDPYLVGQLAMSRFALGTVPFDRPGSGRSGYGWRGRLRLALRAFRSLGWLPQEQRRPASPLVIAERLGWLP